MKLKLVLGLVAKPLRAWRVGFLGGDFIALKLKVGGILNID